MAEVVERRVARSSPERELWEFVAIAFAVSWVAGVAGAALLGPAAYLVGVFGPAIAALWVTRRHEGSARSLWAQVLRWRLAPRWYVVAIAGPLALLGVSIGLVRMFGGSWTLEDPLPLAAAPVFFIFAVFVAGGPEELGWRGYALPRLQCRWSALTASLIVGVLWAIWHAPLWFMPDLAFTDLSYPLYALQILGACVVYTWLYNSTRGSVALAMVLHASTNLAAMYLATSLAAQAAFTGAWLVSAAVVIVRFGAQHLAATDRIDRDALDRLTPPLAER